ncbi:phage tail protein [Chitinimonas koreensis]|uniref:phage tail protein n=1 Tax=Chitinimonas koreensis TaxID=356302 RepID=UPI0004292124|nr:tail fiber protein [Chitinimonas koreensis]QNM98305.1 tail fiber protein [Chitinimonas koreensis]
MTIRTLIRSTMLTGLVVATSAQAFACGEDAYIGQICIMAGSYCPANTVEPQGQLLSINTYQALYSLVGCNTYSGGDCRTTFGIPDLRGRAPVGWGQGPGLTAHPMGQKFGQESVVQTVAMLAAHTHGATYTPGGGGTSGSSVQVKARQASGTSDTPQAGSMLGQSSTTSSEQVNLYLDPTVTSGTDVALGGVSGGGGSSSGGTVTIATSGGGMPIPTVPPQIALRYCLVVNGLYPPRP